MKLGISGALTKRFINSPLTPLFLIAALMAGLIALATIPREEDPQIHVPMVDIIVNTDGLKASDATELVTKPLEVVLRSIPGIEHIYSSTQDNHVLVTARFVVGTNEDKAVLLVNDKIRDNLNRIPIGIPPPLIVGRGIDDVAILTLTLTPKQNAASYWNAGALTDLAQKLQGELIKVPDVGLTYISGENPEQIRVEPDPEKLMLYGVTLQQLVARIKEANQSFSAAMVRNNEQMQTVQAGGNLSGIPDIGLLLVTTRDNRPVYVRDVAKVVFAPAPKEERVWAFNKSAKGWIHTPAVTLAIAKISGSNAVNVADAVLAQVKMLQGQLIPGDISVQVTRNYGQTATQKANELLFHLALATISIVLLIGFTLGWREAAVTAVVIPTTILLTLFSAEMMGYTINRVSLFALIFAIGILVDDAIVVIENITRHWAMNDGRPRMQAAIEAVAEVGNPTIVATLTVITALLPMLFVSGLMGPYMSPIPAVASAAMAFSFFVAMIIAPWTMMKVSGGKAAPQHPSGLGPMGRFYVRIASPLLRTRKRALLFLLATGIATITACSLFYFDIVKVKLLPFDNKSELDVVLNLPPGNSLEDTERTLLAAARIAGRNKDVVSMQLYAGTAAPFDFNGLVRHYYARSAPELGELHIVLTNKDDRSRQSHAIAAELRRQLNQGIKLPPDGVIKVVEVPPGPPVIASLLAEIYGPDAKIRREEAEHVKAIFKSIPFITDVDDSFGQPPPQLQLHTNQDALEYFGVQQSDVNDTIKDLFLAQGIGYSYRGESRLPLEITIGLPKTGLTWNNAVASTPVPANVLPGERKIVELGQLVTPKIVQGSRTIYRRDGHFADMVMGEMTGKFESPIYGMLAVDKAIAHANWGNLPKPEIRFFSQPRDEAKPSLLWDGEWQITYVTFRDMGIAFGVAILGIYVLVVAQFGSFKLPLVVLVPIPLTLIGIMLGHWLLNADFTATSMIGFIALAGIIVRNSILLVDFIRHRQGSGRALRDVLLEAGAIRIKPIMLTAIAAMISAATILSDPIFQGLATALFFGLASSTLLTVLVIPAIYVVLRDDRRPPST
ncbi:efflux RND transporter permease subunit [Acidocella aminolytica]|jgi:multidrug efflux pump subunit AcrB|uniref:Efflux system protein/acriflavin resistance protein n=1 Tax=Acidocella aminolytica 101 = DSM 11237 TaxID=1120923 RepID=A0A0D6PGH9_9PROT|nr:efflux RND transporter permease subunit [Acidocella aminolytica]GAN80880.1 efflux system protein/acriflavin resistance protein [Acidocella aminolytica 101 = DSM 11237]SHE31018.1 Multidrug efflux pump subunit AcrB [Acidocella aminolytica 101 = DSM 11237]